MFRLECQRLCIIINCRSDLAKRVPGARPVIESLDEFGVQRYGVCQV